MLFIYRAGVFHAGRDDDFHADFFVEGFDVIVAGAVMEDADDAFLLAFSDAEDAAFTFAVGADAAEFDQHLVTVHGVADFRRRNKDVSEELAAGARRERVGFRGDEAVAVAMHVEAADDEVLRRGGGRESPALFADGDEFLLAGKVAQELLDGAAVFAADAEVVEDLLVAGDVARLLGDVAEDFVCGDHISPLVTGF